MAIQALDCSSSILFLSDVEKKTQSLLFDHGALTRIIKHVTERPGRRAARGRPTSRSELVIAACPPELRNLWRNPPARNDDAVKSRTLAQGAAPRRPT